MVIGLFSLGQLVTQFKAVQEGCAAGKLAFEVIERVPVIEESQEHSIKHEV